MAKIYLNEKWKFTENFSEELCQAEYKGNDLSEVRLPHTCKELPYHYFDETLYQMVSGYRRVLTVPELWKEKTILFTCEGAGHEATLFVNGKEIFTHSCGYTGFTVDISEYLSFGEDNIKNRISHMIHFKKAPAWLTAVTAVLAAVFLAGFCSDRFVRAHDFSAAIATGCKAVKYEEKSTHGYLTIIMDGSGENVVVKVTDNGLKEMLQNRELSDISEIIMNLDAPHSRRRQKQDGNINVWNLLRDNYYEQFLELKQINFKGE